MIKIRTTYFTNKLKKHLVIKSELEILSQKSTILIFLLCITELALTLLLVPISFAGNDDTAMNAISSGAMTGEPSEFLLFTNVILGYALKFLFSSSPHINWYSWYLIITFLLGYTAIQYVFFKINHNIIAKVTIHLILFALLYPCLLGLQFTKIAAIALTGGFILLFSSKEKNYFSLLFGAFLIIVGSMIRTEVFYMYIILTAPFILIFYIHKKQQLIYIAIAITIGFCLIAFNNHIYNNHQDFKNYKVFNKLRSALTTYDNPSFTFEHNKTVLNNLGWNYEDFDVASNFNLDIGHPKFHNDILEEIACSINKTEKKYNISRILAKLYYTVITIIIYFKNHFHYLLGISMLLASILINKNRKIITTIFAYLAFILITAWMLTIYLNGNLKERVIWAFILPLCLLINFFYFTEKQNNRIISSPTPKNILYGLLVIVSLSVIARYTRGAMILNNDSKRASDKAIAEFLSKQPLNFYVSWCDLAKYDPLDLPYSKKNQYTLGWLAGSPFNKKKIKKYTGKDDIGVYTIFNKNIVWFYRNNAFYKKNRFHEKVKAFYLTNYNNVNIKNEIIPITTKDTIFKYTFFIPKDQK